jgi:hypothetical protein
MTKEQFDFAIENSIPIGWNKNLEASVDDFFKFIINNIPKGCMFYFISTYSEDDKLNEVIVTKNKLDISNIIDNIIDSSESFQIRKFKN